MSTLTVRKFRTAEGAESVETALKSLQKEGLVKILDAAVVTWPAGRSKPRTKQLINLVGAGALSGTFQLLHAGLSGLARDGRRAAVVDPGDRLGPPDLVRERTGQDLPRFGSREAAVEHGAQAMSGPG